MSKSFQAEYQAWLNRDDVKELQQELNRNGFHNLRKLGFKRLKTGGRRTARILQRGDIVVKYNTYELVTEDVVKQRTELKTCPTVRVIYKPENCTTAFTMLIQPIVSKPLKRAKKDRDKMNKYIEIVDSCTRNWGYWKKYPVLFDW